MTDAWRSNRSQPAPYQKPVTELSGHSLEILAGRHDRRWQPVAMGRGTKEAQARKGLGPRFQTYNRDCRRREIGHELGTNCLMETSCTWNNHCIDTESAVSSHYLPN